MSNFNLASLVKPLVWDAKYKSGVYRIIETHDQGPKPLLLSHGSDIIGWFDTLGAADTAAQAHHISTTLCAMRADMITALAAAGLEQAAMIGENAMASVGFDKDFDAYVDAIRALITTDAQAALDAVVQAAILNFSTFLGPIADLLPPAGTDG